MGRLSTDNGVALFTDGSAWDVDGSGGWGWVAVDAFDGHETDSGHTSDTTNNRMEMQAWIEGLTTIYEKYGKCDIIVYCDSQVIGRGFTGENKRKKNLDLWEPLLAAANKHHHVEWEWIKGHNGNIFNVEADKLASAARKQGKKEREECLRRK